MFLLNKFIFIFLILICQSAFATSHWVNFNKDVKNQQIILENINKYRSQQGLKPLQMNGEISREAEKHSMALAENKIPFGHEGFSLRVGHLRHYFLNSHAFAENVAYSSQDANTVVKQWLDSSPHRQNIEGNYNFTGIGIAHSKDGKVYVTQIFLREDRPVG